MNDKNRKSESQWVALLKDGDARSFDQLFHLYGKRLYHFSHGYLKSKPEAEEVVQEVFMKIWQNRNHLKSELSFNAYLFKIAFRHIAEKFRKINLEKKYLHQIANDSIIFSDELNEQTNYHSLLKLIEDLIDKLPQRQKESLIMRRMEGLQISEIAEKLNIAPKTVEHHITEALKNIKAALGRENISGMLFFVLFVKS